MKKYALLYSVIITMVICSCHINTQEKFIEREKVEIQKEIDNILIELGYTDFSIHLYCHKNFNNREISKSVSTKKYLVMGFQ